MLNNNSPLLSIIVPTKDRYDYLKKLIELITTFENRDFELVIQDNSSDNTKFNEFILSNKDNRIRYFYNSEPLTSVQNFDAAVLNSKGKYVLFIGDDDFLLRNICDVAIFMDKEEIDAVKFHRADYFWPEIKRNGATLTTGYFTGGIFMYDPMESLKSVLKSGCQELNLLPSLYYGIISRVSLDKLYKIAGTYFPGNSADIANGVAMSLLIKRYVYIDIPFVIPGTSRNTGGGVRKKKNSILPLEEVTFISKDAASKWDDSLPRIWHGSLVWPESALTALKTLNNIEFKKYLNYKKIWIKFACVDENCFQDAKSRYGSSISFYMDYYRYKIMIHIKSILNYSIKQLTSTHRLGGYYYRNLYTPLQAEPFLYELTKSKKLSLSLKH